MPKYFDHCKKCGSKNIDNSYKCEKCNHILIDQPSFEERADILIRSGVFLPKENEKKSIQDKIFNTIINSVPKLKTSLRKLGKLKNVFGDKSADELLKWNELKEKGAISNKEFEKIKNKLLDNNLEIN